MASSCKSPKNFFLVKLMKKLRCDEREKLMSHLNDNAINVLSECVYNIICDNPKIDCKKKSSLRKKLSPHKHNLRIIGNKALSIKRRRKALSQEGGMLGTILATAIPLLTSLITGLTQK